MKTLAVLLGGMFWAAAGCTDGTGDVSGASDLDSKAPIGDVSGNQSQDSTPAGPDSSQDASQAGSSDDQVSTFDGDAAQTFEDVTARHCDSHNRMPEQRAGARRDRRVHDGEHAGLHRPRQRVLPGPGHQRPALRELPRADRRLDHHPRAAPRRVSTPPTAARSTTASGSARCSAPTTARTRRTPTCRRWRKRRQRLQHAAQQGPDPRRPAVPANAEFELVAVDDPYNFASAAELSLFRRPLPTTNLKFLSTVMWDGRETRAGPGRSRFDLPTQANDATHGPRPGPAR